MWGDRMFINNINGNKNKVLIKQDSREKSNNIIKEIIIGIIITVIGGIILYFIVGE